MLFILGLLATNAYDILQRAVSVVFYANKKHKGISNLQRFSRIFGQNPFQLRTIDK